MANQATRDAGLTFNVESVRKDLKQFYETNFEKVNDTKDGDDKNTQAIVVVSFGTTFDDSREKCIESVENKITEMFPYYEVRRAFTSNIVMKKLADRGIQVDNLDLCGCPNSFQKVHQKYAMPTKDLFQLKQVLYFS